MALSLQAPTTARAGTPFAVTVRALDETGAVATSYRGTVTFVTDDRRAPVLPASYTFTYADQGVHTFTGVELHWAGPRTIAVNDVADPWLSGGAAVLVKAGPLAALAVSAPSRTTAGVPFAVQVSPVDAWRNWVVSYRGTVAFRSDDPAVRALPARYTFVAADRGTHTFTGVTLVSSGRFRVFATDTAQPAVTGSAPTLVANAGAAVQGQVLSGLDPIGGATVKVYDAVTRRVLGSVTLDRLTHEYRITGLPAGAVKLGATHPARLPDFANDKDTLAAGDVFTLRPGVTLVQSFAPANFGPYLDLAETAG